MAQAIWDSAIVKLVLGGGSNADDLADLSRLIGERRERETSESWSGSGLGQRSVSISTRDRPILPPHMLRRLRFGHGLLLLRSAPPIMLTLQRWTDRRDGADLARSRAEVERAIQGASTSPEGEVSDAFAPAR
jgi:type IV secretory pathway TraG/TraD family ATPase VirD4